jgi:hypothetical protein
MAKLLYVLNVSLDGYIADEDGKFDWAAPDEEFSWCGYAPTVVSTPTRHHGPLAAPAARAAMVPSSTAPTRPPGQLLAPPTP